MEHVLVLRAYKRIAIIKMTCTAIRNKKLLLEAQISSTKRIMQLNMNILKLIVIH